MNSINLDHEGDFDFIEKGKKELKRSTLGEKNKPKAI